MKVIFAYLGGLIAVWLIAKGKEWGYVPDDNQLIYALGPAISGALMDDYEWLVDWLNKLKEKSGK